MKKNVCLIIFLIVSPMFFSCSKADIIPFVPDDSFQISLTVIKTPNPFIFQLIADVRYTCQSNVTMRVVVDWGDGNLVSRHPLSYLPPIMELALQILAFTSTTSSREHAVIQSKQLLLLKAALAHQ